MKIQIYSCLVFLLTVQLGWAQTSKVLPELKQKVELASKEIVNVPTNPMDPVSVNATLVWSQDKTQLAVVLKVDIEEAWHIYAYVPETQPFITSELKLELPEGVTTLGDWVKPYSEPYEDDIYVYHDTIVFVQYCSVGNYKKTDVIGCGIYYQTCDLHKCFPPVTKSKTLSLL